MVTTMKPTAGGACMVFIERLMLPVRIFASKKKNKPFSLMASNKL
jgi:hypothetical protein